MPGCAEDVIGTTFYKYILTNVVSINGVELLSAIGKKCLHMQSYIDAPWVSDRHICSVSTFVSVTIGVCLIGDVQLAGYTLA